MFSMNVYFVFVPVGEKTLDVNARTFPLIKSKMCIFGRFF